MVICGRPNIGFRCQVSGVRPNIRVLKKQGGPLSPPDSDQRVLQKTVGTEADPADPHRF
jgi:hypothetical protein